MTKGTKISFVGSSTGMSTSSVNRLCGSTESSPPTNPESSQQQIKVYKRRWIMLGIYVMVYMTNAFSWLQYSIITDVVMKFYSVESQSVNWTSAVFMVTYIALVFPGGWLMDRMGLRWSLIFGSIGTTVAAWINVIAADPSRFYVVMIAQALSAVSQVFIMSIPANLAAVWFGPDQVSSACSIGVFGSQLGFALGFLIPPIAVTDHPNVEDIGADLRRLFFITAGICSTLFLVVVFVFQDKPPFPPSPARTQTSDGSPSYLQSIRRLVKNPSYVILLVTYGTNVGVFYAMSTLLNQTILSNFPNENENAGRIGLTIVLAGMVGAILCGIILDKTHRFKETTLAVYWFSVISMVAYTFTFQLGYISIVFVTAGAVGFFVTGYLAVGYEFAAELTYPEPEVTSSGLLNCSANVFGIALTFGCGKLLDDYGYLVCNGTLSATLLLGAIVTFFIRGELKRQKANQDSAKSLAATVPHP